MSHTKLHYTANSKAQMMCELSRVSRSCCMNTFRRVLQWPSYFGAGGTVSIEIDMGRQINKSGKRWRPA